MEEWTYKNPGLGNMQCLSDCVSDLGRGAERLTTAASEVTSSRSKLTESWYGYTAGQADTLLAGLATREDEIAEAILFVINAINAYIDIVNGISVAAAGYLADRVDAVGRLSKTYMDDPSNPPSNEEYAGRASAWRLAGKDLKAADAALAELGASRTRAERAFVVTIGQTISQHLSPGFSTADFSWEDRLAANDEVWMLYGEFRDGAGNHRLLLDGDPFVDLLQASEHVNATREQVQAWVNAGSLAAGDEGDASRSLKNAYVVGAGDLSNIFTLGVAGNLPESFLGSYAMTVTIDDIDEQGRATVTYTVHNVTSIESFARNPLVPGTYFEPLYSDLQALQAQGTHLDVEQTIVWTEQLTPARS